jgi:hypothetical protein
MCLAAVFAAVLVGPLDAAPLSSGQTAASSDSGALPIIVPAASRGQDRAFSGISRSGTAAPVPEYRTTHVTEPPNGHFERLATPIGELPTSLNADGRAQSVSHEIPAARNWIAVVGAVAKPGCHELSASSITVAELINARCGGLTSSSATLAVVRNGKPLGLVYNPQDRLLANDVVVVRETDGSSTGVAIASHDLAPASNAPQAGIQLGLVNVLDHPIPVMVPPSHATVAGVLAIADQKHLRPANVKVVMAGTDEVFGDQAGPLLPGSVLVFEPGSIDAEALGDVETRHYFATPPAPAPPEPLPPTAMQIEPSLRTLQPAPSGPFESLDPAQDDELFATPQGRAVSQPPSDLTSIPPVDLLDAPADQTMRFPRTADASGAVPIGPPEADSHIVPLPADAIYDSTSPPLKETASSPPVVEPSPVTLSDDETSSEKSKIDDLSFEELIPTVFIGTILGAATFFVLRRRSGGRILETVISRLRSIRPIPGSRGSVRQIETEQPASTPNDMLAALVADRLAFREEPVALPQALRIHGRSPALQYRRVDAAAAAIPEPHITRSAPATTREQAAHSNRNESSEAADSMKRAAGARIDPAQPIAAADRAHPSATPFERALAATRAKQNSGVR